MTDHKFPLRMDITVHDAEESQPAPVAHVAFAVQQLLDENAYEWLLEAMGHPHPRQGFTITVESEKPTESFEDWSRKTPTEPGFYFYRPLGTENPNHVWVAQVVKTKENGLFCSTADFRSALRDRITHRPVAEARGFWWGPIPSPPPCHWIA